MRFIQFAIHISLGLVLGFSFLAIETNSSAQENEGLNIVATHTMLADVVSNVTGDTGYVVSLMAPGEDPHSFNLSARDIVTLDDADIIFVNGADFEESLVDVIYETAGNKTVAASACVNILPVADIGIDHHHDHDDDAHDEHEDDADHDHDDGDEHDEHEDDADHDHDDGDEHDEHEDDADHDHDTDSDYCNQYHVEISAISETSDYGAATLGHLHDLDCEVESCDPHVWMDIQNVMIWTLQIRDSLIELDPANEEIYRDNAANYLAQLADVDAEISESLTQIPPENRILVTNHDVLSYLANRYDFDIIGTVIPSASTNAEPSTSDIIDIITLIEDTGVVAIFVDNTVSSLVSEQVADETGVRVQVLYTGSLSEADEPAATYINYMRYNTQQIVDGLNP